MTNRPYRSPCLHQSCHDRAGCRSLPLVPGPTPPRLLGTGSPAIDSRTAPNPCQVRPLPLFRLGTETSSSCSLCGRQRKLFMHCKDENPSHKTKPWLSFSSCEGEVESCLFMLPPDKHTAAKHKSCQ